MLCSGFAMQMAPVAIGWQVYSIHHSAFDLGPDRARRVRCRCRCSRCPPASSPTGCRGSTLVMVWGFADAVVMALLLVVTLNGAAPALAVRRARRRSPASLGGARQPGRPLAGARARAGRAADRRARAALDRRPGRDDRRPGRRRPALRDPARGGLRARRSCCSSRRRRCSCRVTRPERGGARAARRRARRALLGGIRFIRSDADHPRCDHARPVRGALRRRRRAAAALRAVDPPHRAVRARRAAQRGRRRRADRRRSGSRAGRSAATPGARCCSSSARSARA